MEDVAIMLNDMHDELADEYEHALTPVGKLFISHAMKHIGEAFYHVGQAMKIEQRVVVVAAEIAAANEADG